MIKTIKHLNSSRLIREALDDLAYPNHKRATITQLALSNGYYDQPHFNSNFNSFIKTTPKNFAKEDFFLTIKNNDLFAFIKFYL
ncbi:Helix-turn-helix domain [Chryseobacterium indologenes]|nr:Helix-turn-helix domain [Chryseobacterium indologenes]